MKSDKILILAAVILVVIVILSVQRKKKQESSWWLFDKKTPPQTPSMAGCTSCWVSSIEEGVPYCRWYDAYGRNTQTYEGRGCNPVQANIGFGKSRKKKWWELLFNI